LSQDTRGGTSCHTAHQRHRQQLKTDVHPLRAEPQGVSRCRRQPVHMKKSKTRTFT
jgi:hypothetical protein